MPKFAAFTQAGTAPTPPFAQAQAMDDRLKSQQELQAETLRSQQLLSAAQLYNAGMGENAPIADWFKSKFGSGAGAESTIPSVDAAIAAPSSAIDTSALALAPEATAGAEAAALVAPEAGALAGAETAAGAAAINPYVAAALAGYALTQTDVGKDVGQGMLDIGGGLMGKGWLWS